MVQIQHIWKKQTQPRDIITFSVAALESKYQVFEILVILLEIPSISTSRCEKPNISKFWFKKPSILIEIQGFRS